MHNTCGHQPMHSYKFVLVREPCGIPNVTGSSHDGDYSEQELKLESTQRIHGLKDIAEGVYQTNF